MDLANGSGIVGDNSGKIEGIAISLEVNLLFELAFETSLEHVLARSEHLGVVDMSPNAERILAVKASFGLAIGSACQEKTISVTDEHVGDDLLKGGIFLNQGARAKRVVGEDKVEAPLQVVGGEAASQQGIDAGSRDDEDVFVHPSMLLGQGRSVHTNRSRAGRRARREAKFAVSPQAAAPGGGAVL